MLELDLTITAEEALAECRGRGLVVNSERALAGRPGGRHWHLGIPGRPGTLELSDSAGRVWVKVHPRRAGDWAPRVARELATASAPSVIERAPVRVMLKRGADEQASITRVWDELERALASLRGRRFYGVFDAAGHEYRACVELREDDDPESLGLELDTLPGGRYARLRLRGEPPALYARIGPVFQTLARRSDCDRTRPGIEFYRRRDVVDLLQPIE